jgi:hypothetical protein
MQKARSKCASAFAKSGPGANKVISAVQLFFPPDDGGQPDAPKALEKVGQVVRLISSKGVGVKTWPMPALGHKRASEREPAMSALPLIADPRPLAGLLLSDVPLAIQRIAGPRGNNHSCGVAAQIPLGGGGDHSNSHSSNSPDLRLAPVELTPHDRGFFLGASASVGRPISSCCASGCRGVFRSGSV